MAITAEPGEEGRAKWGTTADYVGIITDIREGPEGKELSINWLYRRSDLLREGISLPGDFSANELCFSALSNWIPHDSVTGKVYILPQLMAEAVYPPLPPQGLASKGFFYYRSRLRGGQLQREGAWPELNHWPRCDELTCGQLLRLMRTTIKSSMNPSAGAHKVHLRFHVPLTALPYFLNVASSFRRTPASIIWSGDIAAAFDTLLGQGWDLRDKEGETGVDRAEVVRGSLELRYHFVRAVAYLKLGYRRKRFSTDAGASRAVRRQWVYLDANYDDSAAAQVSLPVYNKEGTAVLLVVEKLNPTDTLAWVRQRIKYKHADAAPQYFQFCYRGCLIRSRQEERMLVSSIPAPAEGEPVDPYLVLRLLERDEEMEPLD